MRVSDLERITVLEDGMEARCPACGDKGFIGPDLVCTSCHSRLEYSEPGRLEVEAEHVTCPGCKRCNPRGQARCEGCGQTVQAECPLCRSLHPIKSRFCTRKGVPIPSRGKQPLVAAGILAAGLFLGGLGSLLGTHMMKPAGPPPAKITASAGRPQVDVVFVLDATGSMADEIDVVKSQIRTMMEKVQSGQPKPYVRFGLVAFRDRGDEYVTRSQPLTDDIQVIQRELDGVMADGGGDTPEAVNQAMHAGIQEMNWNYDQNTKRVLFLIGDAAPHMDYADDYDYRQELAVAHRKGIKVHAWGCSGIQDSGENEFREIAGIGAGDFQYLTYRQEVVKADGSSGYVLFQGKRAVEQKSAAADWKKGADKLAPTDVEAVPASAYSAPTAGGGPSFATSSYRAKDGTQMENNLDRVLTEQVMDEAKSLGTKY